MIERRQALAAAARPAPHATASGIDAAHPPGQRAAIPAAIDAASHVVSQAAASVPAGEPPLIDPTLLAGADKILFIAHLALGDFTYLQSCFQAFAQAHPQLKIHLWVDERRRTRKPAAWPHLKKYALYDWLDECPCFDKVYKETYSPALYRRSLAEARREGYPVVVSLAELERHKYAILARKISPQGFVVGQKKPVRRFDFFKKTIYRRLDAFILALPSSAYGGQHISDIYAGWFARLFGLHIAPAARFPVLAVGERWRRYARAQFAAWGFATGPGAPPVLFLNAYSKSVERSWPLDRIIELIRAMQAQQAWRGAGFVVNVVPEDLARARALFAAAGLDRTHLFSAEDNFFQLPAVLSLCSLIVSVETAVMHLANAVHVPVIALMRQKTPHWAPIDKANSTVITVQRAQDWVDRIGVLEVMDVLARHAPAAGATETTTAHGA
ncbi:glycosyltransferase family 9 protein [Massilia sp. 9096]|uniref:glycosyltransferase family 9 protein n=1 Tax=Massilia sp. 9096 TaxID=1500894 RepID=UPI000ADC024A|nr:glycosyltransferase family 9 protein [Massilia sp. 9096]